MLEQDCRISVSQMARRLRRNRNVISYRLQRLEKEHIIDRYIASVNLGKLGYNTFKVYLRLGRKEGEEGLVRWLRERKEVIHIIRLEGEYNLSCVVVARDVVALDGFLGEIRTAFTEAIRDLHVSIIVYSRIFKFEKLLLNKKEHAIKSERYSSGARSMQLDDSDRVLLKALSQDARASYMKLVETTGLSLDMVRYRMRKLRNSVINSFRILINMGSIGYFHHVILLRTERMTQSDEQRLVAWCTMRRNVLYCTKRIGEYDFEINVAITGIDDLRGTLSDLQADFSDIIAGQSSILLSKVEKLDYFPF